MKGPKYVLVCADGTEMRTDRRGARDRLNRGTVVCDPFAGREYNYTRAERRRLAAMMRHDKEWKVRLRAQLKEQRAKLEAT